MHRTLRLLTCGALAPVTVAASVWAAESAAWRGVPGAVGDVVAFDVAAPAGAHAVAGLTAIRLLPLDFCGHSAADELATRFPRRRADVPGAARLVLQNGRGSLYHFVRAGTVTDTYGFFVVDAQGPRILHERSTPVGAPDPFVSSLAVSHDGATLLVATTPQAGGDLFELEVATGISRSRTANLAPFDFGPHGLALGPQSGFAVHANGVVRYVRALTGDAVGVPFPAPAPSWFSRELVLSIQGDHAATTAGASPLAAFVFAFGVSDDAVRVSSAPSSLSGAGFFPAGDGPHLAISDDGSTVAWRSDGAKHEAFMAHAKPLGGELPEQLTSDARFLDTLDEIGLYGFKPASNRLVVAVGAVDPLAPDMLDKADFFAVDLPSGGAPSFVNLSLSSGDPTVPFTVAPTLKPGLAHWIAGANAFLVHDTATERALVVRADQSGPQVLLGDAKGLDWIEPLAGELLLSVRSGQGSKPQQLWRVDAQLTGAPVLVANFPAGNELERVALRADGWLAFVESGAPTEFLWLYGSAAAQVKLLTTRPLVYGPSVGFAPTGEALFSVGATGNLALFGAWPVSGAPKRLPIGPLQPGCVLPGP